jgi:sterol-4alpha-carboxylate 3-dehydrogenase (decarboxylating)
MAPVLSTPSHSVLVVGGVGFVGYHIVSYFIAHNSFKAVTVLSRSAASSSNRVEGATYLTGNLADHGDIRLLLEKLKPSIIIHAASPSPVTGTRKEYETVNIKGTRNLLKCAKESDHVRAFIYTSSSTLARGPEHLNLDESCALANTDKKATPYARSKAEAEVMVLEANSQMSTKDDSWSGYLATASLRFPIIYGTRDPTTIPGCLNALAKGQTNATLGDGKNLWSFCSAENCAVSHVLLASALVAPYTPGVSMGQIDGEAFNINDGQPYPFWGFAALVWKFAGYTPPSDAKTTRLPTWFALTLSTLLEWIYWIFTLGFKRPYNLGKQQVEYACFTHTYNIEKAEKRLGYKPKVDFERDLQRSVEWNIDEGGWKEKLKDVKGLKLSKA